MRILVEPDFSAVKIVVACDLGWYIIFGFFTIVFFVGAIGAFFTAWQKFNVIKDFGFWHKRFHDPGTDFTKSAGPNFIIFIILGMFAIFAIYIFFRDVFCHCLC